MLKEIFKLVLRRPWLADYLRRQYHAARTPPGNPPDTDVGEASPLACRPSAIRSSRLNLLIPALSTRHVFGGISTALQLFRALGEDFPRLRIVLTEESSFTAQDNRQFADWPICSLDNDDDLHRCIVPAGDRYGRALAVGPQDIFIATAWWTAVSARAIQAWQRNAFGEAPRYAYLIQDFEPGFYPWSARSSLAESTYHQPADFIAVINSSPLASFFEQEGFRFDRSLVFEPRINGRLAERLPRVAHEPRRRQILVYGRPGVPRNGFELLVMGLRAWVADKPDCNWTFLSAGEAHAPVDLGYGHVLRSVGKLSLDDYALELARSQIGVSLMISPHPSYPPLEMAAFGMQVITNRHKGKDLSALSPLIHSLEVASPQAIADALERMTNRPPAQPAAVHPRWADYLAGGNPFEAVMPKLLGEWRILDPERATGS